ncbi:hypothetical protein MASR2M15_06930 [Anaerolineales bacterium]
MDDKKLQVELENLYQASSTTDSLTDDAAQLLMPWGEKHLRRLANEHDDLDKPARDLRRFLKAIARLVGDYDGEDPTMNQERKERLIDHVARVGLEITLEQIDRVFSDYSDTNARLSALLNTLDDLEPPIDPNPDPNLDPTAQSASDLPLAPAIEPLVEADSDTDLLADTPPPSPESSSDSDLPIAPTVKPLIEPDTDSTVNPDINLDDSQDTPPVSRENIESLSDRLSKLFNTHKNEEPSDHD